MIFGVPVHHRANSRSHILPTSRPLGKPFFLYFKKFTHQFTHNYGNTSFAPPGQVLKVRALQKSFCHFFASHLHFNLLRISPTISRYVSLLSSLPRQSVLASLHGYSLWKMKSCINRFLPLLYWKWGHSEYPGISCSAFTGEALSPNKQLNHRISTH